MCMLVAVNEMLSLVGAGGGTSEMSNNNELLRERETLNQSVWRLQYNRVNIKPAQVHIKLRDKEK